MLLEGKVEECRAAFYAADTSGDGLLGALGDDLHGSMLSMIHWLFGENVKQSAVKATCSDLNRVVTFAKASVAYG